MSACSWGRLVSAWWTNKLKPGIFVSRACVTRGAPGKTLLARAIASNIDANFLKVVSSAIVDKYIGESARLIREMFGYAKEHQPCIIFMDEIDAIGGRRFSEGTSADREIQRTLMELLSQLDGFDVIGKVGRQAGLLCWLAAIPCSSGGVGVCSCPAATSYLDWLAQPVLSACYPTSYHSWFVFFCFEHGEGTCPVSMIACTRDFKVHCPTTCMVAAL